MNLCEIALWCKPLPKIGKRIVHLVITSSLLLFGCNADDEGVEPLTEILLLKSIHEDGFLKRSYAYNDDSLIVRILEHTGGDTPFRSTLFEYIEDSIVATFLNRDLDTINISYYYQLDDITFRKDKYSNAMELKDYEIVSLTTDGCLNPNTKRYSADGELLTEYIYEKIDNKCSRRTIAKNGDGSVIFTTENYLDGMPGLSASTYVKYYDVSYLSNIVRKNSYSDVGELLESSSYTSYFDYNEKGFPISEVRTSLDGSESTRTFEYINN